MDGATSYDVLFDGTPHRTTEPSKDIEGLEPDTEHTYAVRCNNADGSSRYGTPQKIKTLPEETIPEPEHRKDTGIPPRKPRKKHPDRKQAYKELDLSMS